LNEYGLAPYKMTNDFAQDEVNFILSIGGIEVKHGQKLGQDVTLAQLKKDFSAVFLGVGLTGANKLAVPGEDQDHVFDAANFIAKIRQADDAARIGIGKNVIVIGGGNTAVDIAIQAKKLGADSVTIAYRRGQEHMGATTYEQELAQKNGVQILSWLKPVKIEKDFAEFEMTSLKNDKLTGTGEFVSLKADQIFKAIGQTLSQELSALEIVQGKIKVDDNFQTTMPGVFAGGDCIARGEDLTVTSVQHGKLAAQAIHQILGANPHG
jgi:glutamate synthase (NADPH/NADH) small chain